MSDTQAGAVPIVTYQLWLAGQRTEFEAAYAEDCPIAGAAAKLAAWWAWQYARRAAFEALRKSGVAG